MESGSQRGFWCWGVSKAELKMVMRDKEVQIKMQVGDVKKILKDNAARRAS